MHLDKIDLCHNKMLGLKVCLLIQFKINAWSTIVNHGAKLCYHRHPLTIFTSRGSKEDVETIMF